MLVNPHLRLSRVVLISWKVALAMLAYCAAAYWLEANVIRGTFRIPNNIPALLATALAFFIGFNNTQAYQRWWEARTVWGGLGNDSRSWTRAVLAYAAKNQGVGEATETDSESLPLRLIHRNLGFLYALKKSLRDADDEEFRKYLGAAEQAALGRSANLPAALLDAQARDVQTLRERSQIDGFAFLTLNDLLVRFSDGMGRCERLRNTPFPATYLYFTRVFIWLMVFVLTVDIAEEAGALAIGLGWLIGFVFHVTHLNGQSLVNPFDGNPASVPLDAIVRTAEITTLQALHSPDVPPPVEAVNGEYVL
jgi:putative membrane protein